MQRLMTIFIIIVILTCISGCTTEKWKVTNKDIVGEEVILKYKMPEQWIFKRFNNSTTYQIYKDKTDLNSLGTIDFYKGYTNNFEKEIANSERLENDVLFYKAKTEISEAIVAYRIYVVGKSSDLIVCINLYAFSIDESLAINIAKSIIVNPEV